MVGRRTTGTNARPRVGVGCIPVHVGRLLLVRSRNGLWSTPGGHLEFGESPIEAAIRETREETGVAVRNVAFIAVTNDLVESRGAHYVTLWFRAEAVDPEVSIHDPQEIVEVAWCDPASPLPGPRHVYFENLLAGRTLPPGWSLASLFRAGDRATP